MATGNCSGDSTICFTHELRLKCFFWLDCEPPHSLSFTHKSGKWNMVAKQITQVWIDFDCFHIHCCKLFAVVGYIFPKMPWHFQFKRAFQRQSLFIPPSILLFELGNLTTRYQTDGARFVLLQALKSGAWLLQTGHFCIVKIFEFSLDQSGLFLFFPLCLHKKWARAMNKVFASCKTEVCAEINFCAFKNETCKAWVSNGFFFVQILLTHLLMAFANT